MKKRLFSLTLIAALCLSLFPTGAAPALAADRDTVYVGGVALTSTNNATVYATTDDSGNVSQDSATADDYNIKWDGSTLTLDGAKIKGGTSSGSLYATVGIYAFNNSGGVSLNIALKGVNEIFESSNGIWVYSSFTNAGNATLAIEGEGSLNASGSSSGILVQSNSGDATLTIQDADVTAENSSSSGDGVTVRAGESSNASLSVDGGSLTATGKNEDCAGIRYTFGSSSFGSGKPSLTVSDSAIVKASGDGGEGGIRDNSSTDIQIGKGDNSSGGIVFDGDEGTVYGSATLQEDLTIGEGESLALAENASLSAGSHNVIVNGGTLDEGIKNSLGDSVKYTPTITTTTLPNGTVGATYNQTLAATGTTPIKWSIAEDSSLPTNLTLNASTGEISGTPNTAETSTFTVTATNDYGSDSKQFALTIEAATNVSVESVSLDKTTLELTEGSTETLTATITPDNATDKGLLWTINNPDIIKFHEGATANNSQIISAVSPGIATITVAATDGSGVSATCTVTVNAATTITTQPQSVSVTEGQSATFSVTATGDNLRYQWKINSGNGWSDITGATDASYTIERTTIAMSGNQYCCVVTGDGGETTSSAATLTVRSYEPTYTGKYSYEIVSNVGENGTIDVDRYATEGDQVTITVSPDEAYLLDDLTVTSGGKDVELTDNGDGTYTFTMPSGDVAITATFAEDPNWEEPEDPATDVSEIFTDVPVNHWAKAAIQYVYDNGLMTGVSDTTFAPEATTTRAMIVSMLARMENVTSAADAGFTDVAADDWYATAVNWAAANGIVSGISDDTFAPNTAITREQLAAMLMKYAQYKGLDTTARADLSHYSDAENISSWANDVLSWAVAEGLLAGVTDDQLQPQGQATRAQVAAIMQRFLENVCA